MSDLTIKNGHGGRYIQVDTVHRVLLRRWRPEYKGGYPPLGFAIGSKTYDDAWSWQVLVLDCRGGSAAFIESLHQAASLLWRDADERGEVTAADTFRDAAGTRKEPV